MMRLFPKKEVKDQYIIQASKYARGSFVTYKCRCGTSPCVVSQVYIADRYVGPIAFIDNVYKDGKYLPSSHNVFKDGENMPSYNWEQIESGTVPYSTLPELFLIDLHQEHLNDCP